MQYSTIAPHFLESTNNLTQQARKGITAQMIEGNYNENTSPTGDMYRIFRRNRNLPVQELFGKEDEDGQSITSETASAVTACEFEKLSVGIRTYLMGYFSRRNMSFYHQNNTPLMDEFHDILDKEYNLALQDNTSSGGRTIEAQLSSARNILLQLRNIFTESKQKHSPLQIPEQSRQILFHSMESFLRHKVVLLQHESSASPEDVANVITLINRLLTLMEESFPEIDISESWQADLNVLIEKYLDAGVRQSIRTFRGTARESKFRGEIKEKPKGRLSTEFPVSIIEIIDAQVAAAKQCLPSKYIQVVQSACNEEMSELLSEMLLSIEESWESLSSRQFCAFLNDVDLLRELMARRNMKHLIHPSFRKKAETFKQDSIYLSQQAASLFAQRIMRELVVSEKILSNIGDAKWEKEENRTGVLRTISVLKVHYKTFQCFLGDEFPRLLKACFDQTLQLYVESFLLNTFHRRCSARNVSKALEADYALFLNFYNGDLLDNYYGRKGFYSLQTLNLHLHLLKSMANVIQPNRCADELKQDVKALLRAFEPTEKATRAVLHLVAMNQSSDGLESWLDMIAEAKNENSKEGSHSSFRFDIPLEIPLLEKSQHGQAKKATIRSARQTRPVAKCIRGLKKPPVVLRAQSDTVSVV